jgi:hypothetical protein
LENDPTYQDAQLAVPIVQILEAADEEKSFIRFETLVSWPKCPTTFVGRGPNGSVQGEAVFEMRVGLSQPEYRIRLQTGSSCGD